MLRSYLQTLQVQTDRYFITFKTYNRCPCGSGYLAKHPDERRCPSEETVHPENSNKPAVAPAEQAQTAKAPPGNATNAANPVEVDTRVFTKLLRNPRDDEREEQEKQAEKARLKVNGLFGSVFSSSLF